MKKINRFIIEKLKLTKNKVQEYNYFPKNKQELIKLVDKLIHEQTSDNIDLNDINTSEIDDMSELFCNCHFNVDVSKWDVSKVTDMSFMFRGSKFNGDISKWDVRNVKDMTDIFYRCPLKDNPPIWYKK